MDTSSLILSASGWRGIFAASGNEEDKTTEIDETHKSFSQIMAAVYADYILSLKEAAGLAQMAGIGSWGTGSESPVIAVGTDARPTGPAIADQMIPVLLAKGLSVEYLGITAAPEIMAYSHKVDGFVYISASHNPVGHNGVKFGLNDGGVLPGPVASKLAADFRERCSKRDAASSAQELADSADRNALDLVYKTSPDAKKRAIDAYKAFTSHVISDEEDEAAQRPLFTAIHDSLKEKQLGVVCDFNGSARTLSIDRKVFNENGISYFAINDKPGQIVHAIIPEPENLVHVAAEMERLHKKHPEVALGYMPDCDGDRGNIVFWNEKTGAPEVLKAQEVFALSVMAELAFMTWKNGGSAPEKLAVSVNDPTSMRIEEIATAFNARVARAEVGEANVVNRARELRNEGYTVRILGEGSNGGNITHPAAVRDPINSLFALIKLLVLRDKKNADGTLSKGLFHLWCSLSGQEEAYNADFTLADVMATLPVYTTTGVSEPRAVLHIHTMDHAALKAAYQRVFNAEWEDKSALLKEKYGITGWTAVCNNGTKETLNVTDFSISQKGGLKIKLLNADSEPVAFIWMRGSGTEPVFRVMCDVKGNKPEMEAELLQWHTGMIAAADRA